jgi:hypothetical protein
MLRLDLAVWQEAQKENYKRTNQGDLKMRQTFIAIATSIAIAFLLIGCTTYHMTTESLLEQCAKSKPELTGGYLFTFPFVFPGMITLNSLTEIKVLDKEGDEQIIPVTNHTGIRITKKDGKRKTFYFNTLIIQDSTITGANEHFFGVKIKPINLNNIQLIELQK